MVFNPQLEPAISTARLDTYRAVATDDDHAWALYRWNIDLTAAFAPLACDVEVTLRNTIHDRLSAKFGRTDWWASPDLVLDDTTTDMLVEVLKRHRKQLAKGTLSHGKIVADLSLGTWVVLLSRGGTSVLGRPIDYETNLWRPTLRLGFAIGTFTSGGRPRRPTRDDVHARASNLQRLRNRMAHHEPIFGGVKPSGVNQQVPLLTVWQETVELLGWMSHELAALHQANPTVPNLLAARP